MLLIGFIFVGMWFLRVISLMHNFPSTVLSPKRLIGKLVISYNCADLVLIFKFMLMFIYKSTISFDR